MEVFLYHLLVNEGFKVRIFDVRKVPSCNCAWGINKKCKKSIPIKEFIISKPKTRGNRVKLLSVLWKNMRFGKIKNPKMKKIHFHQEFLSN